MEEVVPWELTVNEAAEVFTWICSYVFVQKRRVEKLEKHQERVSERTCTVLVFSRYTNCRNAQLLFRPAGIKSQSPNS